jgi:hypothetical protein
VHVVRAGAFDRYRLLASAIAGRTVDVVDAEAGALPWSDGATIFVAAGTGESDAIRAIVVQAVLIASGSLDPAVMAKLGRREAVTQRYLTLEGHRALAEHEPLLPMVAGSLIDPVTAGRSHSAEQSLAIAISREEVTRPPVDFGAIRPRRVRAPAARDETAASGQPRPPSHQQVLQELADEDDTDASLDLDMFTISGGGGAIGKLLKRFLGDARSKGEGEPTGDDATSWSRRRSRRRASSATTGEATTSALRVLEGLEARPFLYPEWDEHHHRYRQAWCTVRELPVDEDSDSHFVAPDGQALRRALGRLGMELERRRRQLQGDDIDLDAAVEARVALVAGGAPDEAIYIDNLRSRRDLSVLVLLDISGSASEPSATGATVHEHQRLGAAALTIALQDLGDRVALYGFRSAGRANVEILPVKRFEGDLGETMMRRLGALQPGGYTRLGAAIRHGTMVVDTEGGTARRMLVVVSDGFAYDHGYEAGYGEADARRALAEARRQGVACLCLSIGADTDVQSLRRVFGTAAHAVVPRADQLPQMVGPLFRASLRLADAQRRMSQRRERTRERHQMERRTA